MNLEEELGFRIRQYEKEHAKLFPDENMRLSLYVDLKDFFVLDMRTQSDYASWVAKKMIENESEELVDYWAKMILDECDGDTCCTPTSESVGTIALLTYHTSSLYKNQLIELWEKWRNKYSGRKSILVKYLNYFAVGISFIVGYYTGKVLNGK